MGKAQTPTLGKKEVGEAGWQGGGMQRRVKAQLSSATQLISGSRLR